MLASAAMGEASSSALLEARAVYDKEPCTRSFEEDVCSHLEHGFLYSSPELFIMARPVDRYASEEFILNPDYTFIKPNCWLVWLCAGRIPRIWHALSLTGLHLPFVGFQRSNRLRYYEFTKLYAKLSARTYPSSDSLLQGRRPCPETTEASDADYGC